MKNILQELIQFNKQQAFEILNKAAAIRAKTQLKITEESKIHNTEIQKKLLKNRFYLPNIKEDIESNTEVTLKIISQNSLYFLKTTLMKYKNTYYFESYENLFELVRRKSPRLQIPKEWSQSAFIQSLDKNSLRSICRVLDLSETGMKLKVGPQIPRYEKNQIINLKFKIFRRGEIVLRAKVVHLKKAPSGGPIIGVQFADDTKLIKNKIQNIYNDLAFYYVNQAKA